MEQIHESSLKPPSNTSPISAGRPHAEHACVRTGVQQYRRPPERPFTIEEKSKTTILSGGLTSKHEKLIQAALQGEGYHFQALPTPTNGAFQVGKEFCNNGLCNPYYYTVGNLLRYLRDLQHSGLNHEQISESYLYLSLGGCGPCRFGMYESEYRQALLNAGFDCFRILTFQNGKVFREGSKQPGLQFTMDLALGILNALILGDLLYGMSYQIRPYEIQQGQTNRVIEECVKDLSEFLRSRPRFHILERTPGWFSCRLQRQDSYKRLLDNLGKFHDHFWADNYKAVLCRCAERLNQIEVDRTRPKPVVKIVGEFFSQLQEGDANYSAFSFLEHEGAEVAVDSIASLLQYWLYYYQLKCEAHLGPRLPCQSPNWWQWRRRLANQTAIAKKMLITEAAIRLYHHLYRRVAEQLGGLAPPLPQQKELAELARPFFDPLVEGGEGHLEVAKSIYYTVHKRAHMVLSLKPFGCMPSTQSDGVMATVSNRIDGLLFLSVETSGEGEINAHSRIQMALGEAHRKARSEFDRALKATGKPLEEIRQYVNSHTELRKPFYRFTRQPATTGVAANFIQHVSRLIDREKNRWGSRP